MKLGVGRVVSRVVRIDVTIPMWLQASSLNALTKPAFFSFAIQALHPVLNLVYGLLLTVKTLDSDDVEDVNDEVALD